MSCYLRIVCPDSQKHCNFECNHFISHNLFLLLTEMSFFNQYNTHCSELHQILKLLFVLALNQSLNLINF